MAHSSTPSLPTLKTLSLLAQGTLLLFMVSSLATLLMAAAMAFGEARASFALESLVPFETTKVVYDYQTGQYSLVSLFSPTVMLVAANVLGWFLLVTVPVLLWLHRSYAFLEQRGLSGLRSTPRKAVAEVLIPVVNLVQAPKIMRELYNRTMGGDEYQVDTDVNDIQVWWTTLLSGTIVLLVLTLIGWFNFNGLIYITTPPGVNAVGAMLALILLIASALHLFLVIGKIAKVQPQMSGPEAEDFADKGIADPA